MPCSVAAAVLILTNQNVRRLAVDNGRVTGVIIGSGEFIGARNGIVLATGGYGANPEMSWRFEQLPGFAHEASGLMPASLDRRWPRPRGRDRRNIAQGMRRQGQLLEQRSGVAKPHRDADETGLRRSHRGSWPQRFRQGRM